MALTVNSDGDRLLWKSYVNHRLHTYHQCSLSSYNATHCSRLAMSQQRGIFAAANISDKGHKPLMPVKPITLDIYMLYNETRWNREIKKW